jgi:hypothetical protein
VPAVLGSEERSVRILVACEHSGIVREAFRSWGHDAWSCDLLPAPGHHIQGDVLRLITGVSGAFGGPWDLMIAHHPCTFLSASGMHWTTRGFRPKSKTEDALDFVVDLMNANIERIAIENPIGVIGTRIRPADQWIQPYEFGEDASKKTGLWLKNLPLLEPTEYVEPRMVNGKARWGNQTDSGQNRLGPSKDRWAKRSQTYSGIANAMAEQWGNLT